MFFRAGLICAALAVSIAGCDSDTVPPRPHDSGAETSGLDARTDRNKADSAPKLDGLKDAGKADTPAPDVNTQPDQAPPDSAQPDTSLPDSAQPDTSLPDSAQPDTSLPDKAIPDLLVPDAAQPDMMQPDQLVPDLVPPDQGIPVVTITNPSPLSVVPVNKAHTILFKAVGGLGPGSYKWSGTVPAWSKLDPNTGVFSGTPTVPGTYPITVRVDSGPRFDQRSYKLEVASAMSLSAAAKPYFKAQCSATSQIKIKSLFAGGKGPYTCTVYTGAGRGTFPGKLTYATSDPSGCTLTGGFDPKTDPPGTYGFLVTVSDTLGQKVDVPVTCKNGDCPSSTMSMTPAIWPPRVMSPKTSYKWLMNLSGVDLLCKNVSCTHCSTCMDIVIAINGPITADANLDCLKPGDVCLYNSKFGIWSKCPGTTTWHGEPMVKVHTPQRATGLPAWNTLEMKMSYSGNTLNPCGGKTWSCHWDTLEQ